MELWYTEKHTPTSGITAKTKGTVYSVTTPYQELAIIDTIDFGKILLLDGIIMLSEKDEFVYHEMITNPALYTHPNPERVLIIGGGDGGTLREVVKHPSVKEAVLVEIDGEVINASKIHLPNVSSGFNSPKAKIMIADGINYVKATDDRYDVVLIDSTDPIGPAVGLFSAAFYANCSRVLKEDGILTVQLETPFIESFAQIIPRVLGDFKKLFAETNLYLASVPTYPAGLWSFAMGSKKYNPIKDFQLARYQADNLKLRYYNDEIHKAAFSLPNFVKELIG